MIAIVDYGRGNLFSIGEALRHLRHDSRITDDPEEILSADRIILPGVGAFGGAMADLHKKRLIPPIQAAVQNGTPLLGICLGMQLLGEYGEEFGRHEGLGLIPGVVRRLPEGDQSEDSMRIPNTGWRLTQINENDTGLSHLPEMNWLYFVHSYSLVVDEPLHITATTCMNNSKVTAAVRRDNVIGFQFHPEKSGEIGLEFLKYFLHEPDTN